MAEVTMYRSQAGGLFETAFEEHRDDLRLMIEKMIDNAPLAKQLAEKLTNGQFETFRATVEAMWNARPGCPVAAAIMPEIADRIPPVYDTIEKANAGGCNVAGRVLRPNGPSPRTCPKCGLGPCSYRFEGPGA